MANEAIATVLQVTGDAWARDEDGNLRPLQPGDTLHAGEVLVTSDNGSVQLAFAGDGAAVQVSGGQEVAMTAVLAQLDNPANDNTDNVDPQAADDDGSILDQDVQAVLAAINDGNQDLLDQVDPTAVGDAGNAADAGGDNDFTQLARVAVNADPLSFDFLPPSLLTGPDAPLGGAAIGESSSTDVDIVASVDDTPPGGDGPAGNGGDEPAGDGEEEPTGSRGDGGVGGTGGSGSDDGSDIPGNAGGPEIGTGGDGGSGGDGGPSQGDDSDDGDTDTGGDGGAGGNNGSDGDESQSQPDDSGGTNDPDDQGSTGETFAEAHGIVIANTTADPDTQQPILDANSQDDQNVHVYGNTVALNGGAGDDHLIVENNPDLSQEYRQSLASVQLTGGDGNDILEIRGDVSDTGSFTLDGGAGDDTLIGGAGDDTLTGGEGADTFVWKQGVEGTSDNPAHDTVTDFNTDDGDKLDLSELLDGDADKDNIGDYLHFESDNDGTTVYVSTDGQMDGTNYDTVATQTIQLQGVTGLQGDNDTDIAQQLIQGGNLDIDG